MQRSVILESALVLALLLLAGCSAVASGSDLGGAGSLRLSEPYIRIEGIAGRPLDASLGAEGGVKPYVWQLLSGTFPQGLAFEESAGRIHGTPEWTADGMFQLTVAVSDAAGRKVAGIVELVLAPAILTISNQELGPVYAQEPFSILMQTHGPAGTLRWSMLSVAAWIDIDEDTGRLFGTPSEESAASTVSVTISVENLDTQETTSQDFGIEVLETAPAEFVILTRNLAKVIEGEPYAHLISVYGGSGNFEFRGTNLPTWLSLNASSGLLSGSAPASGSPQTLNIRVKDKGTESSHSARYVLEFLPAGSLHIPTAQLPVAMVGGGYSESVTAEGGTGDYAWAIRPVGMLEGDSTNFVLPPFVNALFSAGSAEMLLAGAVESSVRPGTVFIFEVEVQDEALNVARRELAIRVIPNTGAEEVVMLNAPTDGTVGGTYELQLESMGGSGVHEYSVFTGDLPPGLLLGSDGLLAGTPTTEGLYEFTVEVVDNSGTFAIFDHVPSAVRIYPQASQLMIVDPGLVRAEGDGGFYLANVAAIGGDASAYQWSVTGGTQLPPGLEIDTQGTPATRLFGTPTTKGDYSFELTVTDDSGAQESATITMRIGNIGGVEYKIFAGNGTYGHFQDGTHRSLASLAHPGGLSFGNDGTVYISNAFSHSISAADPYSGELRTVAGSTLKGVGIDGVLATDLGVRMNYPFSVAPDSRGNLFIADWGSGLIRKVDTEGVMHIIGGNVAGSSIVSSGDGGPLRSAFFAMPFGVVVDAQDNLYISEAVGHVVRKVLVDPISGEVTKDSIVEAFAGSQSSSNPIRESAGRLATDVQILSVLAQITLDPQDGSMLLATDYEGAYRITKDGRVSAQLVSNLFCSGAVAVDQHGNIYTGGANIDGVWVLKPGSSDPELFADVYGVHALVIDPQQQYLYMADYWRNTILYAPIAE